MRLLVFTFSVAGMLLLPTASLAQGSSPSSGEASGPSIEERVSNTESWLARLERVGITGYVQARGVRQENATRDCALHGSSPESPSTTRPATR
jgi:hypothetical protein